MYQQKQNKNQDTYFQIEEGKIAEKTSYVDNLNRLIAHINHVSVYPTAGSYAEGVSQLDAMLEAYKDEKFSFDFDILNKKIKEATKSFEDKDKEAWLEQHQNELSRSLFKILMRLLSRSGLSPTARITAIDAGE